MSHTVIKQLLDALKEMVSIVEIHSEETDNNFAWAELSCARQAIAVAEQAQQAEATLCGTCARANVDCPIYPQQTASCVEHRPAVQQQAEPVAMSLPFFAYDSETGFERFATEAKAKQYVQDGIDECRSNMLQGEAWPSEIENLCWGVVLGTTKEIKLGDADDGSGDYYSDYALTDAAQPPAVAVPDDWRDAATSALRFIEANAGHDQLCEVFDMDDDGRHKACTCGMEDAVKKLRAMLAAAPQAATEGCGACGDGCKGHGCRLERESPPTCQTCNGQGMIGGLLPNGGGYDSEPCPDCAAPKPTAEDSSAVRDAVTVPDEWRSPSNTPVVALGDALHCWLAVKSKHDSKVRVYDAYFCNFPLMQDEAGDFPDWTLHDESGEEVAMVGWAEKVAHPDFNDFYSALGDIELIGWQPVNPPVAPTAAQKGGAA